MRLSTRNLACLLLIPIAFLASRVQAEEVCLDLSFEGPRGKVCIFPEGHSSGYVLRMRPPGQAKAVEVFIELTEGESLDMDRVDTLDLADEVLIWLPVTRGLEGHTLMLVYRIQAKLWERLPVRWMCQRHCTSQHVSYQTTHKGGPANTRIFYESVVNGQYLKSTYAWDGKHLSPLEIEEPRSTDALNRGYQAPPIRPVCKRSPKVRDAIVKRAKAPCGRIGPDQLAGITRLSLDRKDLKRLRPGDFSGLSGLTSLDLSHNPLTRLPRGVFAGLFKLRSLNFQGCKLATVPGGVFKHLGSLKDLYLNHNRLTRLPPDAFEGLDSLTFLSLNHNRLESLAPNLFDALKKSCNVYLSNNRAPLRRSSSNP